MDNSIFSGVIADVWEWGWEDLVPCIAADVGRPDEEAGGGVVEVDVQAGGLTWNQIWDGEFVWILKCEDGFFKFSIDYQI